MDYRGRIRVMESKRYRNFLEAESKRAPIEKRQSSSGRHFWILWEEKMDKITIGKGTSDIIDLLYFGEDLSRPVIIDRKVARMIQERLKGLEDENIRLHKQVRVMKIISCGLALAASMVIMALLLGG